MIRSGTRRLVFILSSLLLLLGGAYACAAGAAPPAQQAQKQALIDSVRFLGSRRIPEQTLRSRVFSKRGDVYDPEALRRDFMSLWNSGFFEDIRLEVEDSPEGKKVTFHVREKPTIRTIEYKGNKSVTNSEILDRFKERKVGITTESQYDPTKVRRAEVVLQELLGERGRQFASVKAEPKRVPPNSVILTFNVDEGPKVKVGLIEFTGNQVLGDRALRSAMKHLKPIGIPRSWLLESLFSRSYDESKLAEDLELVRGKYQDRGYFTALVLEPDQQLRSVGGGGGFRLPLFYPNKPGKRVDMTIPVQEGDQYRMGKLTFAGVKFFRQPDALMRPMFQMQEGDIFSATKVRKGLENIKKLYGEFGFISEVTSPDTDIDKDKKVINLTLNIEEDKQFFVRRIEFSGNTTTRDKVIRRELLLDEGDMFNNRLWEVSLLRLNQLGFFEQLKPEAANIKTDNKAGQVDIALKVKEKGKNTIGLTGGVSGIAGSFIGLNYSTNNFMGLGETLTFSVELGSRERNILFGFTEPFLFDRPLQSGFTVFARRFNYNQGREASILTGQNLIPLFQQLGSDNILDYRQASIGFTSFASYPLRRGFLSGGGFARVGLTFGYDNSSITTFGAASQQYFQFLNFRGVSGPSALEGIKTSKIIPTYTFNTVDNPMNPHTGRSLFLGLELAGLGGNVRMYRPTVSFTMFRPVQKKRNVLGMRLMGSFMSGYGGIVAPPFERYYIGGETDVRGFDIRTISPMAMIPDAASVNVINADGSARTIPVIGGDGQLTNIAQMVTFPVNRIIFPGGDTQGIGNFEYRIPIFGPVTLAAFFDAGLNTILRRSQLAMSASRGNELLGQFPGLVLPDRLQLLPGTNRQVRTSTGLELQVILPIVQAPFRLYWAYNPTRLRQNLATPLLLDRSMFPNLATYYLAVASSPHVAWFEPPRVFRFTISRTF